MAVKIVRKPFAFLVKCSKCGTKITCEREDLKTGYRCFGGYDEWEVKYVKCPTCGKDLDVYSEGKLVKGVKIVQHEEEKIC